MTPTPPKVTVVIVAFDNPTGTHDLLNDLQRQTLPLHRTIVVDNSSGTETEHIVQQSFPDVIFIRMKENFGSAGGYHEGILTALSDDVDFIWTFDDDIRIERSDILQNLIEGFNKLENSGKRPGAVCSVPNRPPRESMQCCDSFPWKGTLLLASAAKKIGLPLKEYFIYADDVEYSFRLREAGYTIYTIDSSVILEPRQNKSDDMLLNEHLLFYADDFRLYYAFRNELDMYLRHHNFFKAIRTVAYGIKVTLWVAFRFPARRGKITQVYYRGFKDALFSRLGKNPSYIPGERQRS